MMEFENLGQYRKAKVWINDPPETKYQIVDQQTLTLYTNDPMGIGKANIATELRYPSECSYYVLLGLSFVPDTENRLKIIIDVSCDDGEPLMKSPPMVHNGIPQEYVPSIIETTRNFFGHMEEIPSGTIHFNTGAYDDAGSSPSMFGLATRILLSTLLLDPKQISNDKIENILKEFMQR